MQYIKYEQTTACNNSNYLKLSSGQQAVAAVYPFRVSRHYANLIGSPGDAIWRQCIPDPRELEDQYQTADPLSEETLSPVPGLIHRYPDRAVLLVSNRCPVYCRFCMRKRHVGGNDCPPLEQDSLEKILAYIGTTPAIRDVTLSGGDPLMLDNESLHNVLSQLRSIPHVRIIRLGTRIPVTLPERITPDFCDMLRQFHPLYINTHFNHPSEVTAESSNACGLLADAGIPLGNQSVLLRGINDDIVVMRELMTGLLDLRVKPYYIHQMDLVKGTAHFRTPVSRGLEIIRALRGHVSGMAVPHFVIDLPEGKGKVAVLPDGMEREGDMLILRTYQGERIAYRDLKDPPE
jgi:lysine 2,3-aminomutase